MVCSSMLIIGVPGESYYYGSYLALPNYFLFQLLHSFSTLIAIITNFHLHWIHFLVFHTIKLRLHPFVPFLKQLNISL